MGVGIFWPFVKNHMEYASQASLGRMDQCGLMPGTHDKWDLLAALTQAAAEFDLSHRTLGVLKALLSFLPDRTLTPERDSAIVFPSNRKLSERLNGMPESTLRRHLARLTEFGIICRKNSPNRKRYARRTGGDCQLAFGFDLSPLAVHASQIFDAAQIVRAEAEHLAVLRDRVAVLRQQLLDIAPDAAPALLETARKLLRRKPCKSQLSEIETALKSEITRLAPATEDTTPALPTSKMSATDRQNERHIQYSIKLDSDSETEAPASTTTEPQPTTEPEDEPRKANTFAKVLRACPSVDSYFPNALRSWQDADRIAEQLTPMMGIDMPVLNDARAAMGRRDAATVILCMLEKIGTIRSPGAYLRRLAQKARAGQFSTTPMLNALLHPTQIVS